MNFKDYPLDRQRCKIIFESNALSIDEMILSWKNSSSQYKSVDMQSNFYMNGFSMTKYEIAERNVTYKGKNFSQIEVTFVLERVFAFYLLDIYFPAALFVVISWTSFWLEISAAPARVTLGVTTMLTLVTSSRSIRDRLPKVSYVKSIDIYIMICICKSQVYLRKLRLHNLIIYTKYIYMYNKQMYSIHL